MTADILIVDDDPGIRLVLADMLRLEGHDVRVAADGLEALEECSAALPDLMILDLAMPRLDGFGLIGELEQRGWRRLFPIFVLTPRLGACEQLNATTPVEECAQKPFDMDEILAKVRRLISN